MTIGKDIRICGTVQGVGLRPRIWRLAKQFGLTGSVWNDAGGVRIHAWGSQSGMDQFIRELAEQPPPLAQITGIETEILSVEANSTDFRIIASQDGLAHTAIAADAAICPVCLAEVSDPANRRYLYPFTHCIDCGPRLSIIAALPYDRSNTAMSAFAPCPACLQEYQNPADRRFHSQTNCCPNCGPDLWLADRQGQKLNQSAQGAISATAELIRQGYIVAIKGIGGFHLACDAGNQQAVSALRQRKQRYAKPFAIMSTDLNMLGEYVELTHSAAQCLSGSATPIVLLRKEGRSLAPAVAPGNTYLGCMLPYTALHLILLSHLTQPIVLTSGNRCDEPPCLDNDQARENLQGIADFWLLHNRTILHRLDDSVIQLLDNQAQIIRRSRGYAPKPFPLPAGFDANTGVLAMGGELKNTFCLITNGAAIVSPHLGDLENADVQADYRQTLRGYQQLFGFQAKVIAVDLHDGYLSSQLGRQWATQQQLKLQPIQHHHAHIAACMAEFGLALDTPPILGVAMDGLGLGDDGQLWGGEFLKVDYRQATRLAAFEALPLLGGTQAILQPWRNTYTHLRHYFDWQALNRQYPELEIIRFLNHQPLALFDSMLAKNLNSPHTSACGRCFDAFAAALGICLDGISYEGQAAIGLENLATPVFPQTAGMGYPYTSFIHNGLCRLSWKPFWSGILTDLQHEADLALIAAKIHHGLAQAIADNAWHLADSIGTSTVVLSGGVFQNRLLLQEVSRQLRLNGKTPLTPSQLPCNDGGLAFGQAVIALAAAS